MASFKVGIYESDNSANVVFNALRFETKEDAERYSDELGAHWTPFHHSKIFRAGEPPNYTYVQGRMAPLPQVKNE